MPRSSMGVCGCAPLLLLRLADVCHSDQTLAVAAHPALPVAKV